MKVILTVGLLAALTGCATYTSKDKWNDWARANNCVATGNKKILLAGSVYSVPQRRKVFEFRCDTGVVWSDLGSYAKHNEWLTL